jgi:hypothetical protein
MPNVNQTTYPGAMALLNYARQYYGGAEVIFASKPDLTGVLYFLYFQTVESLLKAYLKAHGNERWGHGISKLCAEAQQLGLKIERDKSGTLDLPNVVVLLEKRETPMRVSLLYVGIQKQTRLGLPVKLDIIVRVL